MGELAGPERTTHCAPVKPVAVLAKPSTAVMVSANGVPAVGEGVDSVNLEAPPATTVIGVVAGVTPVAATVSVVLWAS